MVCIFDLGWKHLWITSKYGTYQNTDQNVSVLKKIVSSVKLCCIIQRTYHDHYLTFSFLVYHSCITFTKTHPIFFILILIFNFVPAQNQNFWMTLIRNKSMLNRTTPQLVLSSAQESQQICGKARMWTMQFRTRPMICNSMSLSQQSRSKWMS